MMSTLPATADVVIVGAGPTGLALACVLAAEGVSVVLLERKVPTRRAPR
jgi:2-polyprenyl-6-methoxyphenol hydroxylase-like FAD-dependent oxidoreductase